LSINPATIEPMTAPGNSALVASLMAVFVACAAYAIGRLHQRRQMDRDREDAYQEGYDNATRSTFRLAARAVARRRAGRPAGDVLGIGADGSSVGVPSAGVPSAGVPSAGVPSAGVPSAGLSSAGVPITGEPEHVSAVSPRSAVPPPAALSPNPPPVSRPPRSPPTEHNTAPLGFPVPPPAPPQLIGEPAAFGGVVYRAFPDPRLVGNSEPLPADRGSLHGVSSPGSSSPGSSSPGSSSSGSSSSGSSSPGSSSPRPAGLAAASAEGEPASTGRHTVPDELVRSTTYRLPADRVFRARVPEPADRPALPDEPTTKISVPKPRQS
jgi:hypothetical protein